MIVRIKFFMMFGVGSERKILYSERPVERVRHDQENKIQHRHHAFRGDGIVPRA